MFKDYSKTVNPRRYIANASQFRLVLREFETLQIITVFTCIDTVDRVLWSKNSKLILTCCYKRNVSQVWSVDNTSWKSKLDEGSSGLIDALWCPDSKQILTWSEFGVRINVWSLKNKTVRHVQSPKLGSEGCKFTRSRVVIAETRDRQDHVSVFDLDSWNLLCNFKLHTEDMQSITVVNKSIFVCDTSFNPVYYCYSMEGQCLAKHQLYSNALGVKQLSLSPSNQFVALGCFDSKCRLVNSVTWSVIKDLKHSANSITTETVCYAEVESTSGSRYEVITGKFTLPQVKVNPDDPNLLLGVGLVAFSKSGRYIATRNDSSPGCVWIWSVEDLKLCALISHASPILTMEWDPANSIAEERIAMTCNSDHVYMWSKDGALALKIPNCSTLNGAGELGPIRTIEWCERGNSLILKGDYHFSLCYFPHI